MGPRGQDGAREAVAKGVPPGGRHHPLHTLQGGGLTHLPRSISSSRAQGLLSHSFSKWQFPRQLSCPCFTSEWALGEGCGLVGRTAQLRENRELGRKWVRSTDKAGTPHTFHCPHPLHGRPLPTSPGIRLCVGDLSSGYGGRSSGRDSPRAVCAPPPEAICRRDDGSEVAEWPAGTPTAGGRAGPGASKAILDRLTAAASSLGGSGSYRGWAHPERQPAGHLCPLTSILAGRTGEAVSATARLRTRTLCPRALPDKSLHAPYSYWMAGGPGASGSHVWWS